MASFGYRSCLLLVLTAILHHSIISEANTIRIDERHSYSLSTFDTSGKLAQVDAAAIAASLGTPILAVCQPGRVFLASPQILPFAFAKDDGTARFATVSPAIFMAHTGISADGRVLVAAAQKLAVEYAYTFDEPISIDSFLEEMSLLMQSYTMKVGARPFGATLLVAYIPGGESSSNAELSVPKLYRIDPSGSVLRLKSYAILNGNFKVEELSQALSDMAARRSDPASGRKEISEILENALRQSVNTKQDEKFRNMRILSASMGLDEGLIVKRIVHENES